MLSPEHGHKFLIYKIVLTKDQIVVTKNNWEGNIEQVIKFGNNIHSLTVPDKLSIICLKNQIKYDC